MTRERDPEGLESRPLGRALVAEPWFDKRDLANHLACSVRSVETALAEGMPHAVIFGRPKFKVSIVEPWLEQHGYIERVDEIAATVDAGTEMGPHR